MTTSRTDFNESWLVEAPMGVGKMGDGFFNTIANSIQEYMDAGIVPEILKNEFKKIQGQQVAYYWHEHNNTITIASEFTIKPQVLVVNGIAKNPNTQSSVGAIELYNTVLSDNHKSIKLMSDSILSDDGYNLWKRLLQSGHTISVYDQMNPGQSLVSIKTVNDMNDFFKHGDKDYRRWQYILSESNIKLAETRSYFNTRRMRELSGLGTED
jgi:hypothetical protein